MNTYITKRNMMLQQWASKDLWILVKGYNILFNIIMNSRECVNLLELYSACV